VAPPYNKWPYPIIYYAVAVPSLKN